MKVQKFVKELYFRLILLIYIIRLTDLEKVIDYTIWAYTKYKVYNKKSKEIELAEQVE